MAPKSVLAEIKRDLDSYVGARIRLKANKGRKKVLEREGVLEQTYPNIFVVRLDEGDLGERRVSYSYTDLLTEAVELVVYDAGKETKIECHGR
ncbi:Veg family protein [Caldinitratiruptor microaerophilus]|uniref:Veg protein n=1 Tax=Caldinitratiruptor microaerophilus TaxID=671077 RepID=A0AA35CNY0_9FIRM|nr:Veg family protein [Caldinitratiruptor microaerophilus]BDG61993.1 hypothetical protein caldi_30830 [Caldinitratiruptor microaerophilus]